MLVDGRGTPSFKSIIQADSSAWNTARMHHPRRRAVLARSLGVLAAGGLLFGACGGDDDDADDDDEAASEQVVTSVERVVVAGGDATVLAVVGDAGDLDDNTLAVAALVDAQQPDAVLTVGDNEYSEEGRTVEAYARSVGEVYGSWVDAGSFFPIPGDHDYGDRCDDEEAEPDLDPYLEFFDLPVGPEDETYYDVRFGDVHVFALDSNEACHRDGGAKLERQRRWLAETASASDAAVKVALVHNPPYSSGSSHGSAEGLRWDYGEWGIDLVISGDDHIYERSLHDDVTYVVNGLGGVEAHEVGDRIEGSLVTFADEFGALLLVVDGEGARGSFVDVTGRTVDAFQLDVEIPQRPPFTVSSTWHWQLQGDLDTSVDADVYDIDLFQTSAEDIAALQADGRIVICYFSAGSYEGWRPDADRFADSDLGRTLDGFEDERWLDVRSDSVRAVVEGRLDRAVAAGCDGVEPDNVDGDTNDTGFDLTASDSLDFNRFIARNARARGLLVGLKNADRHVLDLVDEFDFAVNEQCHEFDECDAFDPFVAQGKPVFNAEYAQEYVDDPSSICADALDRDFRTLVLPLDLDGSFRISCD